MAEAHLRKQEATTSHRGDAGLTKPCHRGPQRAIFGAVVVLFGVKHVRIVVWHGDPEGGDVGQPAPEGSGAPADFEDTEGNLGGDS